MRPAAAFTLLLLLGCKESGPSPEQLAKKACDEQGPKVRALAAQVAAIRAMNVPAVKADQPPAQPVKPQDSSFADEKTSALEACVEQLDACGADTRLDKLAACAETETFLLVRITSDEKAVVDQAMLNKYKPGKLTGDALLFALSANGGTPAQLGAVVFEHKLSGGVDVERDAPLAEREKALADGLRRETLAHVVWKLGNPRDR